MASTFESFLSSVQVPPLDFPKGHFTLGASWPLYLPCVVVAVAIPVASPTASVRGKSRVVAIGFLTALRVSALALFSFACFRRHWFSPPWCRSGASLGILLDDSKSMQIADEGAPRGDFSPNTSGPKGSPLLEALGR